MSDLTVTSGADSGTGTLRDALTVAAAGDTIRFDPALFNQTILLTTTLIDTIPVTIDGSATNIAISGGGSVTDFTVDLAAGGQTTIEGLNVINGSGVGATGALGVTMPLGAPGGVGGDAAGGIFAQAGSLDLEDDSFSNDTAVGGTGGMGGIFFTQRGLSVPGGGGNGGNAAGAVYVEDGVVVTAANLTFSANTGSGGQGGAPGSPSIITGPSGTPGVAYANSNDPVVNAGAAAVCFVTGTRIRTTGGECAVEDLVVGDVAVTASGETRPIVWIGHRDTDCRTHYDLHPVRVAAYAFGADLPARDLTLSPGHPVLVGADEDNEGGHLVPIMCLINGTTIARVPVDTVTYWHVELDQHDILLAEQLPAESYLDWGDRDFFSEGSDHALANPDFVVPGLAGRCRPVAVDGPVVEMERRRLKDNFARRLASAASWPDAQNALLSFF